MCKCSYVRLDNGALNLIDSAYAVIAKKHGLTFNSLMILCLIKESEHVTQKKICDELHLPKSTVHSILSDFTKQEYVTLEFGNNKKEKFIIFTESGSRYFSKTFDDTWAFENKILSALGENTCHILVEAAEKLGEIIKDDHKCQANQED